MSNSEIEAAALCILYKDATVGGPLTDPATEATRAGALAAQLVAESDPVLEPKAVVSRIGLILYEDCPEPHRSEAHSNFIDGATQAAEELE